MESKILSILFIALILSFAIATAKSEAADAIETAGDVLAVTLPVTAVGTTLAYKDYTGLLQLGESEGATIGATYGLKYTIKETRPNGLNHSFPSAHTAVSFSAAEFMRSRYGWEYGAPAYVAAAFVAYSRVDCKAHHIYDVIAGAGIGVLSSYIFTTPYKDLTIKAEANSQYLGAKLSYKW